MEIANNNLVTTLSAVDSPSQLSDGNPPVKGAKKKAADGAVDTASFDGALLATMATPSKVPVGPNADLLQKLNEQASAKVELSTKTAAKAENGGAPVPTIASLFQAKAQHDASGKMTGGFVAGPDQPWNSRWVFGADRMPTAEDTNATQVLGEKPAVSLEALKKLITAQAQGGDESQKLKEAAGTTKQEFNSALESMAGELGGNIVSVTTDGKPEAPKGMSGLSGADFLAALQGGKVSAVNSGGGQSMTGQFGGQGNPSDGQSGNPAASAASQSATASLKASALTTSATGKPELQVINGGKSTETRLEGGMKLIKDEPALGPTDSFMGAMPLSTAIRNDSQSVGVPPQMFTGHVVPGSMMKDRFSSESVRNMANGISGMAPQGGGEMKIRMNPANLGELMIHVSTNGKDVGLKVQATESGAKKIIEESLGALRDSLASQNLALGRVDVTLAPTNAQNADNSNSQNPQGQHGAGFDMQSNLQDRSQQQGRAYGDDTSGSSNNGSRSSSASASSSRIAAMAAGSAARTRAAAAESRLDVMA